MGKIMEALFCVFYLVFTPVVGFRTLCSAKTRESKLYGLMTLVLVGGDAFHLIPRIFAAVNPAGNYVVSLGLGKMVTSITMTIFYLMMYFIFEMRYERKNPVLRSLMCVLALIRIVLCLMPQNDWIGEAPVSWGVYRNIPFLVMGIVMVVLYFQERKDLSFRWMWLGILLSFGFYLPVVLWADVHPMIGMLMLPKTCMYIWIVMMGYNDIKKSVRNA